MACQPSSRQIKGERELPDKTPLTAPDFSNRPAYSEAFAGTRGGTRMGPLPLICGCIEPAGWAAKVGAGGGADGMVMPSNLGSGAATANISMHHRQRRPWSPTSEGELGRRVSASLVVADEAQDLAEAGHGQQTAVLRVCNLPYLAQDGRRQLGALEELDGNLARDDAQLLRVGLLEQVLEHALLFWGEVEDGLACASVSLQRTHKHTSTHAVHTGAHGGTRGNAPISPLAERSAMADGCPTMGLAGVDEAAVGDEAGAAPGGLSCIQWRGSYRSGWHRRRLDGTHTSRAKATTNSRSSCSTREDSVGSRWVGRGLPDCERHW